MKMLNLLVSYIQNLNFINTKLYLVCSMFDFKKFQDSMAWASTKANHLQYVR